MTLLLKTVLFPLNIVIGVSLMVSYLSYVSWRFDQLSHFSQWLGFAAMVAILLSLLVKQWRPALVLAVVALPLWGRIVMISPWLLVWNSSNQDISAEDGQLTVAFSNINLHNTQLDLVEAWAETAQADYVFTAETTLKNFRDLEERFADSYPYAFHQAGRGVFGIAVFSPQPLENRVVVHSFSEEGLPSLEVVHRAEDQQLHVLATHPYPPMTEAFTRRRNEQLLGLADYLSTKTSPAILVGDLNTTHHSWVFRALTHQANLQDSRFGRGPANSWPTWAPPQLRISIDHALVSPALDVIQREVGPDVGSDHLPLVVQVQLPTAND